jgi:ketosteroid isomerase-like protein
MSGFRSSPRIASLLGIFLFVLPLTTYGQSTPEAVVGQWMDAFNAGDMAKASAINSPSGTSIIDEFAPYAWNGPKAFAEWGAAFEADVKTHVITDPKVTLGALEVKNVSPTHAYLIFPAVYTYKQKGVPIVEKGHDAIVLHKEGGAWKVVSWAWTGGVPKPAK